MDNDVLEKTHVHNEEKHTHGEDGETRETLVRIILSAILLAAALILTEYVLPDLHLWARLLCFLPAYLTVSGEVIVSAVKNVFHGEIFDEEFLMTVATVGAFAVGEYPEAVFVMLLYQIGEFLGDLAVGKSRRSIAALTKIRPDTATVLRDGREIVVSPDEVEQGEIIVLRPGDRVALDGVVTEGETLLDTSALTGESDPAEAGTGDTVYSGSLVMSGVIRIRTTSSFSESTASRILKLVEESSANKAKSEDFITRFSAVYTPVVVSCAVLLAVVPSLFTGEWQTWIYRALTFLVVSCPCALVISVPLTFFCGLGAASSSGVLIKGSNYLEALAAADTLVCDKTGTLTVGGFSVREVKGVAASDEELLEVTALAETYSNHPIAASIISAYGKTPDEKRLGKVSELSENGARGIAAQIDGETYYVGNAGAASAAGAKIGEIRTPGTSVHVSRGDVYLGYIVLSDTLKPDTSSALERLGSAGMKNVVMLTGDNDGAARVIAEELGVDYRAELMPEDKVGEVETLIGNGAKTVFVGDGINDAPVLARADVGVAMGALGSDAAVEAADVVLMDDSLTGLARGVKVARRTVKIARQNVVFALAVKFCILVLSAAGITGMWLAAFGDVGVMLIAVVNSLRALKKEN